MTVIGGKTVHLMPALAADIGLEAVGPAVWPGNPLETRFVFDGPPDIPDYMKTQ